MKLYVFWDKQGDFYYYASCSFISVAQYRIWLGKDNEGIWLLTCFHWQKIDVCNWHFYMWSSFVAPSLAVVTKEGFLKCVLMIMKYLKFSAPYWPKKCHLNIFRSMSFSFHIPIKFVEAKYLKFFLRPLIDFCPS